MNKMQKAIARYTKQSMKHIKSIYGETENFRITRIWNREDLKEIYGKIPETNTINRLSSLNEKI